MMSISAKEAVILMDDSQYIETLITAFEAPEESEIHSQQERKRQKTIHRQQYVAAGEVRGQGSDRIITEE
jgi:hypothetical protein